MHKQTGERKDTFFLQLAEMRPVLIYTMQGRNGSKKELVSG